MPKKARGPFLNEYVDLSDRAAVDRRTVEGLAYNPPGPPRTAEDWGRVAVSLSGWRWMPGMNIPGHGRIIVSWYEDKEGDKWPDPDDPATAGCLLALLGTGRHVNFHRFHYSGMWHVYYNGTQLGVRSTLGRACIAAAEALGRWPGGAA